MGILYNVPDLKTWGFMAFVLLALIAFNELGRTKKWGGILLFVIVPLVLRRRWLCLCWYLILIVNARCWMPLV